MKGFGFVAGEDGKEYFLHQTGLKEGVTVRENDSVTFDVEQGDKGPRAVHVAKAEKAEESTEEKAEESTEEKTEEPKEEKAE